MQDINHTTGSPVEPVPTYHGGPTSYMQDTNHTTADRRRTCRTLTIRRVERQHAQYSLVSPSHDSAFPAKRRVGFPPWCRLAIHDHRLRFLGLPTGRTNSADTLWTPPRAARSGRCAFLTVLAHSWSASLVRAVSTHRLRSSIALFVRGPLAPL